jgi:integrase
VDAAGILGRTHVLGSLLTNDAPVAKIRASRFYFALADFLNMLRLKMRDEANSSEMLNTRAAALVQKAFALGCKYEADQERLRRIHEEERERLQRDCQAELQAVIRGLQNEWAGGEEVSQLILVGRSEPCPPAFHTEMTFEPSSLHLSAPPVLRSPAWHTLREAFLSDKPGLTSKTLWSYNQAFDIWTNLIRDKAIGDITRADLKLFADHLRDKPNPRGDKLNYQTIQRSLGHIKNFMAWAVAAGHVNDDHFGEVKGRGQTSAERLADDKRRAFIAAEFKKLFDSPLFRAPANEADLAAAWFLLIAALTGARTEEIAEAPAELVRLGDVWCLDLRKVGTKTAAAPRLVPLLCDLIELGLLKWAQRQAEKGRLLVQFGAEKRSPSAWSKYLNRYINRHVSDEAGLVLYSLRHSFRQMLRAANIGDELANKVFGHDTGTVGAGYGKDLSEQGAGLVINAVRPLADLKYLKGLG